MFESLLRDIPQLESCLRDHGTNAPAAAACNFLESYSEIVGASCVTIVPRYVRANGIFESQMANSQAHWGRNCRGLRYSFLKGFGSA